MKMAMELSMFKAVRRKFQKQQFFLLLIVISVVIGITLGCLLNPRINSSAPSLNTKQMYFLEFPGMLFIRMMVLFVAPLAICSNISSLSAIGHKDAGFMTGLGLAYFFVTTVLGATFGLIFVLWVHPGGQYGSHEAMELYNLSLAQGANAFQKRRQLQLEETILNLILNLIPDNIVTATFQKTDLWIQEEVPASENVTGIPSKISTVITNGPNIFGLFCFSILFGIALQQLPREKAQYASEFFDACRRALIHCVSVLIWYFPIGTVSLIAYRITATENLASVLAQLGYYTLASSGALLCQNITNMTLYFLFTRHNPFKFVYSVVPSIACGLGTASSSATFPITLNSLSKNPNINSSVVRVLLSLGTTLNMNGTVVVEVVGPIFILQCLEQTMTVATALTVLVSAVMASMVTGTIPSGGLVTMTIVLDPLDIPAAMIALVVPVDWLLDRLRTPTNIFGNCVAVAVVGHFMDKRMKGNQEDVDGEDEAEAEAEQEQKKDEYQNRLGNHGKGRVSCMENCSVPGTVGVAWQDTSDPDDRENK